MDQPFGIDFGGTGIKGALMDVATGTFVGERIRVPTPQDSTPETIARIFRELLATHPESQGPVGVTVPGIVRHGVVGLAPNIHSSWRGVDAQVLLAQALGRSVHVLNDADAAALAEMEYGAAKGRRGVVLMTTLGTGIGSALIHDGVLVPNFELGHLEIGGRVAEQWAAASVHEAERLSWAEWAERLTAYYRHLERLFSPDLMIVGGGITREQEKFLPLIDVDTEILPAHLRNQAGIVGAALAATRGPA